MLYLAKFGVYVPGVPGVEVTLTNLSLSLSIYLSLLISTTYLSEI